MAIKRRSQPTKFDLEQTALLQQLTELAEKLGFTVRQEDGQFQGGSCRIREDRQLIINKKLPPLQKVKIVASELSRENLDDIFLIPALRQVIDENRPEAGSSEQDETNIPETSEEG